MGRLKKIDAYRMEIREGGGCLSLFGLPFFAAGIFMLLAAVKIIPFSNASEVPQWSYGVIFFMGVAFTLAGGALIFGRTSKTIDRSTGRVTTTTGTVFSFLPAKKEEAYLSNFSTIVVRYNPGDSDTAETYPVSLFSASGREFLLYTAQQYSEAITGAQELTTFLGFPVEDRTSDHPKVYEAGKIKEGLTADLRGPESQSDFARPSDLKSRVRQGQGNVEIFIPGPEVKITVLVPLVVVFTLFALVAPSLLEFFDRTHTPKFVQYFFGGFAVLLFVVPNLISLLYNLAGYKRNGTLVTADSAGIIIEERSGWSVRKTKIVASEIVDFDYSTVASTVDSAKQDMASRFSSSNPDNPLRNHYDVSDKWWFKSILSMARSKGIAVKSRQGIFYFGAGLADAEVRYLYSIVKAPFDRCSSLS